MSHPCDPIGDRRSIILMTRFGDRGTIILTAHFGNSINHFATMFGDREITTPFEIMGFYDRDT